MKNEKRFLVLHSGQRKSVERCIHPPFWHFVDELHSFEQRIPLCCVRHRDLPSQGSLNGFGCLDGLGLFPPKSLQFYKNSARYFSVVRIVAGIFGIDRCNEVQCVCAAHLLCCGEWISWDEELFKPLTPLGCCL